MNEFELIHSFVRGARTSSSDVTLGPGDDCAIIPPFAISTDMSLEDVHFKRDWLDAESIGYRAAAVALSDLAAVAAKPVAAFVSFAFSQTDASAWAPAVMKGVRDLLNEFDVVLAGGDVTRSDKAVIDVTVVGKVDQPILRSGARPGEGVWVTGRLGGAAAALRDHRYIPVKPRISEAIALRAVASSMIDLSDGLGGDAAHIARASAVRLRLNSGLIPRAEGATLADAVQGGEDYELCFTANDVDAAAFERQFGIPVTQIGVVEKGEGVIIENGPEATGFQHFS